MGRKRRTFTYSCIMIERFAERNKYKAYEKGAPPPFPPAARAHAAGSRRHSSGKRHRSTASATCPWRTRFCAGKAAKAGRQLVGPGPLCNKLHIFHNRLTLLLQFRYTKGGTSN